MKHRIVILLLFCFLFSAPVKASQMDVISRQEELYGANKLEGYKTVDAAGFLDGIRTLMNQTLANSDHVITHALFVVLKVLGIVILCRLAESFGDKQEFDVVRLAGTLSIMVLCAKDVRTMIGLGRNTMGEIVEFSKLLMPVLSAAAVTTGDGARMGVTYSLYAAFSGVLIQIANSVIIPGIYAYLALSMTDSALQPTALKGIRELIGWIIEKGLKLLVYTFVFLLTVSGMLAGSADAAAIKATKAALSGLLPVVGGIVANASDALLNGAALIRNSVGTIGMLGIIGIFLYPILQIGISYVLFRITAMLCSLLGSKLQPVLDGISNAMGYLMAMTGTGILISLLSCCCLLRSVTG